MGGQEPRTQPQRPRRQLNLRLDPRAAEILEAVAFLEGKASIQEVVMPLVDDYIEAKARDPQVLAVLNQRAEYLGKVQQPLWDEPGGEESR